MDISKNEEKYQIQVCVRFKPLSARERNVIQVLYSNGKPPTAISICEKQFTVDSKRFTRVHISEMYKTTC